MLADLLSHPGVEERLRLGSRFGVIALHGGLEEGTAEIAASVADRLGATLYTVVQPPDLAWHVPSVAFDPGQSVRLRSFLDHVGAVLSLHGYGRPGYERKVLVGGTNRTSAARLARHLRRLTELEVVDDLSHIPTRLRGVHPDNPVNLTVGEGVQLELPLVARRGRSARRVVEAIVATGGW